MIHDSLPNNTILDLSKLKAFTNKINVTQKLKFAENIVEKGENPGHQHFLFFPTSFQMLSFSGSIKVKIVRLRVFSFSNNPAFQ